MVDHAGDVTGILGQPYRNTALFFATGKAQQIDRAIDHAPAEIDRFDADLG